MRDSGVQLRLLYIGGLGRSGTTLLSRLLAAFDNTCYVGEVVNLFQYGVVLNELCGCGATFYDCNFWKAVGEAAFGGWDNSYAEKILAARSQFDSLHMVPVLAAGRLSAVQRGSLSVYNEAHLRVCSAASEISGADVVIDASKHAQLAHCLRYIPGLDMRVIHSVRDSRAVAHSWTKVRRRPESGERVTYMDRFSPMRSAFLWNGCNAALELLPLFHVPMRLMRYEDLVGDPTESLFSMCQFADLGTAKKDLDLLSPKYLCLDRTHSIGGNPMRFEVGITELQIDDDWRNNLAFRDRCAVSLITAPFLACYGYPLVF